jgi:hypothetical protein
MCLLVLFRVPFHPERVFVHFDYELLIFFFGKLFMGNSLIAEMKEQPSRENLHLPLPGTWGNYLSRLLLK